MLELDREKIEFRLEARAKNDENGSLSGTGFRSQFLLHAMLHCGLSNDCVSYFLVKDVVMRKPF
jgi:hypothetical protein